MGYKVFVDGRTGTTGLKIESYLSQREDVALITLPETLRRDQNARLDCIEKADLSFLCLPDDEAEMIAAAAPPSARIIDASTRHRTRDGWIYGLPELCVEQRARIRRANRVALPGCHATGFILSARPLIDAGLIGADYPFAIHSVTGYSGGGKAMIAEYETAADVSQKSPMHPSQSQAPVVGARQEDGVGRAPGGSSNADQRNLLGAPREYALSQEHKHLPEMVKMAGLSEPPLFSPHVANFYSGLSVVLPLHRRLFLETDFDSAAGRVWESLHDRYEGERLITVHPMRSDPEKGFLSASSMSGRNDLEIFVTGNSQRAVVTARYDNLGKGASGAAVQCMNIMLDTEETKGLA